MSWNTESKSYTRPAAFALRRSRPPGRKSKTRSPAGSRPSSLPNHWAFASGVDHAAKTRSVDAG
jgi:hypothetical protein